MLYTILRKEHKNVWEKRTPLTPSAIDNLHKAGFSIDVEASEVRIFEDGQYQINPDKLCQSPADHQLVIGIKEPPIDSIMEHQVHLCFSHTIKGQDYNMPLLQKFIDQKATLLDYELMTDTQGKRTIAFGEHAGIAGAVDSLWIAGEKLKLVNKKSQLSDIKQTIHYKTISILKQALSGINLQHGTPVRILIIGTGNVGKGAEKVCQWLGLPKLETHDFLDNQLADGSWYTVVSSEHLHQSLSGGDFNYKEYLEQGKSAYKSILDTLLGRFNVLLQTSYWTDFFPRHLEQQQMIDHQQLMPWVIGDISCDINGSFACTQKASTIDNPVFSYDPVTATITDEISWNGISVMSIDNLPCELSLDASEHFSNKLEQYTPHLMQMDLTQDFHDLIMPEELKKSVIVYQGQLTDNFQYLKEFL